MEQIGRLKESGQCPRPTVTQKLPGETGSSKPSKGLGVGASPAARFSADEIVAVLAMETVLPSSRCMDTGGPTGSGGQRFPNDATAVTTLRVGKHSFKLHERSLGFKARKGKRRS